MWPPSSSPAAAARGQPPLNYGLSPDLGVVGLRDLFLVAPASSFHHHSQQQHQPHHQSHEPSILSDPSAAVNASNAAAAATALGVGVGVFPLLTAPCLAQPGGGGSLDEAEPLNDGKHRAAAAAGIPPFWQNHQQQIHQNYPKKTMLFDHNNNATPVNLLHDPSAEGGGCGPSAAATLSSSAVATCQDCGNQAKKDCSHRRCRTCCKNRNFDCATHVKSTWVPASRRRERQLMAPGGASSGSTSVAKKPRLVGGASQTTTTSHTSNSNTPPRSFDTSSSHQDASFKGSLPGQVRAPAVFRCVRVTSLEEGDDEYAYQAVVKIGGHVFKGLLYDQGAQPVRHDHDYPNISELHLGGGGGGRYNNNGASSSSPMLDDVFASAGALMAGGTVSYGNQIS